MNRMINNQKGFTLVEIMMVVIIIGILAVLAIPRYQKYLIESKLAQVSVAVGEIKVGMSKYYNAHKNKYPAVSAAVGNASLEQVLRIELGEKENFIYGVTPTSSVISGNTVDGYYLEAILTTTGATFFGGGTQSGDKVLYYIPQELNPSASDPAWEKGWYDESFFD